LQVIQWLFSPLVLFAIAVIFAQRFRSELRKLSLFLVIVALVLFASLVMTGIMYEPDSTLGDVHKWLGHLSVVNLWTAAPLSLGFFLRVRLRPRPVATPAYCFLILCAVACDLSTSFTGYPGPSHNNYETESVDATRFEVLHMFVLPAITGLLVSTWHMA
jgi:hypothetical protein